jgi:hypothetical protein
MPALETLFLAASVLTVIASLAVLYCAVKLLHDIKQLNDFLKPPDDP